MKPSVGALVALFLLAAACGGGDGGGTISGPTTIPTPGLPVDFTGPDGVPTRVEDVGRIVTLSGDMTEIIFALGLGDNVVAADLSSVYPEAARQIPKVGVEFRLVAEFILRYAPTVVIGDVDARPVEAIEQVRQAGVPVVIMPRFQGLEAPADKIRQVSAVLGVPERGEALARRVQAEIDEAVALAAGATTRPRVAVVYLASANNFLMLGENTVMTGLLDAVGAEDVAPAAGADPYVAMTPEALAAGDPEYIVTAERGLGQYVDGVEGLLALPGVGQTTAGRERNILVYEDLYLLGLGPRTGRLLQDLALALHPELAPGP